MPTKVRNGEEPPLDTWKNFWASTRELQKFSEYFSRLEASLDELSRARLELKSKSDELDKAKQAKDSLFIQFESRYSAWNIERNRLDAELKQSQLNAEEVNRKQLQDLRRQIEATTRTLTLTEQRLDETSTLLESKDEALHAIQQQLKDVLERVGGEEVDEFIRQEFNILFEDLDRITKFYFSRDLPPGLEPDEIFKMLQQSGFQNRCTIPISNSVPSQFLRMYRAQGFLVDCLQNEIFQEPNVVRSGRFPKDALERLKELPHEEAVMRTLIQKIYSSDEKEHRGKVICAKARELGDVMSPLLTSTDRAQFEEEVIAFLETAALAWDKSQRKSGRICTTINTDIGEWDVSPMPPISDTNSELGSPPEEDSKWVLVPYIYVGGQAPLSLIRGIAVWGDEDMVLAGQREAEEQTRRTRPALSARLNNRSTRRRNSVSSPSRVASLHRVVGSIGSSPPGHGSPHRSFSQRVNSRGMEEKSLPEAAVASS
ncbi:hypothetical protein L228DRAFT_285505 [Xylona heveae TC161]|uniref:Uncharacterized protein n=1 Tax=Xylona heveae (strain CBS 132557 / TC161) TaxID=1328760 RepID=A0A164ZUS8_XYLHT|nr:hypothetical protein L228DRAFT_285505 [Xylona heveae TC161]KZF19556.1 hypothetical protein L228DRAFT_285505 [Xylona heveae TC161]